MYEKMRSSLWKGFALILGHAYDEKYYDHEGLILTLKTAFRTIKLSYFTFLRHNEASKVF